MSALCAVPSCERALYAGNASGVCRDHVHTIDFCRCPQCAPDAAKPRYRAADRAQIDAANAATIARGLVKIAEGA